MRIKITGYFEPEDYEQDPTDRTGLTGEAYDLLIAGLGQKPPLSLTDLEDLEVEQE
jgi:hypothetical protein